mmetsp:Transcript_31017/g.77709  ORF Transcript_31017/g.77709 Transcript_31017/m.77709 type:complete len:218 (-) Transcript_31017:43-696(-)
MPCGRTPRATRPRWRSLSWRRSACQRAASASCPPCRALRSCWCRRAPPRVPRAPPAPMPLRRPPSLRAGTCSSCRPARGWISPRERMAPRCGWPTSAGACGRRRAAPESGAFPLSSTDTFTQNPPMLLSYPWLFPTHQHPGRPPANVYSYISLTARHWMAYPEGLKMAGGTEALAGPATGVQRPPTISQRLAQTLEPALAASALIRSMATPQCHGAN